MSAKCPHFYAKNELMSGFVCQLPLSTGKRPVKFAVLLSRINIPEQNQPHLFSQYKVLLFSLI
jgi:hypothetical protein